LKVCVGLQFEGDKAEQWGCGEIFGFGFFPTR
jgi:hypothetical protein